MLVPKNMGYCDPHYTSLRRIDSPLFIKLISAYKTSIVCNIDFGILYLTLACNALWEKGENPFIKNLVGTNIYFIYATEINTQTIN